MSNGVNYPLISTLTLSLHSAIGESLVSLCAGIAVSDGEAPEWIHLLPAGEIRTADGRGPYRVADAAALIATSLNGETDRLILDENHATDLAAPKGEPAPARAWIVGLEARADGIWGKVEWSRAGRRLMIEKAYRAISPAIAHRKDGTVVAILRASLVNRPNLVGLTTLHQETDMTLLQRLLLALKLETTTSEDALVAAVTTLHQAQADSAVALQAQIAPIAKAAGLPEAAAITAIIGAVTGLKTGGNTDAITGLQQQLSEVTTTLNTLRDTTAKEKATAFVDGAIAARRVGVLPLRDHYVAMHMADPARVEKEIGALPSLNASHTAIMPPTAQGNASQLTPDQKTAVALMGISEADFLKTLQSEQTTQAAL